MPGDPLFDTLFRSTTATPPIASAAPVLTAGTRTRAGNAMSRTRAALLDGARRAVEVNGTKITMAQVAAAAGVAKATLYNHFRTRDAVLSALLLDEVTSLTGACAGLALPDALDHAAKALSAHPLLRALARVEPATLATLACIDTGADGWAGARVAVAGALSVDGRGGAMTVLRWLASYLINPGSAGDIADDLAILLAGLPGVPDAAEPDGSRAHRPEGARAQGPEGPRAHGPMHVEAQPA
jgi:AcrR family transcriptional regulator